MVAVLLLGVLGGFGLAMAYRHYARRVDRRLRHSAVYAIQPAPHPALRGRALGRSVAITAMSYTRRPRRTPAFDALPPDLVQAIIAIEDRRFYTHSGINYVRTAECAVQDAFTFHAACGGSTITQQLARVDFLTQQKTVQRKVAEFLIARRLEERLTKQQILALYAQSINLGQQGAQPIRGFRQASQVYFGKDLRQLDLAQCATLAGMIQAPNFDNPFRHPDRALRRRNVVLDAMVDTGVITPAEANQAKTEPLDLVGRDLSPTLFAPQPSAQG